MAAWQAEEYIEALPKLKARELLQMVTVVVIGSGAADPDEQRSIMRNWRQQADELKVQQQRQTPQEHMANLAAMGIPVEIVDG